MSSKESTKNIKKPAGHTGANWKKYDQLIQKYTRESRLLNPQKNQKK